MGECPFEDDATATYRGYRRQALYCLFRLFDDALPGEFVAQPEGSEDLALYDTDDKLVEVVQVKDLSENLTASKFKPSFYQRIARYCHPQSRVAVTIASFGTVGPELFDALDNTKQTPKRVLETLTRDRKVEDRNGSRRIVKGVPRRIAENILSHVTLQQVSEEQLTQTVMDKLSQTITSGDPKRAFDNLMWWLITSAEQQRRLSRSTVIEKLNQIGVFLSHRAAFEYEWSISIVPIEVPNYGEFDLSTLEREFFLGGRVRVNHIAANLDVRRPELLDRIHSSFEIAGVVVVRAASGQGKTTLAYRYILDLVPQDFRFEALRASDLQHARRMATAIAGHSKALGVPTLVYVDVRPGDELWVEFVRELSSIPHVRVLVTIREEDWFRSRVSFDDFGFVDLQIDFDESAGREIYSLLATRADDMEYLDFCDAWAQLGDRKTLFEFVYLVTQAESLAAKIHSQIASLQDAVNSAELLPGELHLLRLVAVASAFEARVELAMLSSVCEIPEPQRTLERFNNEFLLRTSDDGRYVEGFHSIRSELITSRLTDECLAPWHTIALQVLPLLDENDLGVFLLCSFSRQRQSRRDFVTALAEFSPKTWVGVRGVSIALQWLGLDEYTSDNGQLIDNVRAVFGSGWWFTLDWDLAQVQGKPGFGILEALRGTTREFAFAATAMANVAEQQTDKTAVFSCFRDWIENRDGLPNAVRSIPDYVALSEMMYWIGHLGLNVSLPRLVTEERLDEAFRKLSIHLFAEFATAARALSADLYTRWYEANRERIAEGLRRQTRIMALVEDNDCLVGHYVIDLDREASALKHHSSDELRKEVSVNELSVERVEILARCIPGYARYGVNGYGHRMSLINMPEDESEKRMPRENIIMPWLPAFNALARGLAERRFRPEGWDEYFQAIHSMREQVICALSELGRAVEKIRPDSTFVLRDMEAWKRCKAAVNGDFFLPCTAVDEWGYVTESKPDSYGASRTRRFASVSRLDPYNKAVNEYTRTVGNFMQQALDSLVLIPHLREADTRARRKVVLAKAKDVGIDEGSVRLSVINGVDACVAIEDLQQCEEMLFAEQSQHRLSCEFLDRERAAFVSTMRKWCTFAYPAQVASSSRKKKGRERSRDRNGFKGFLKSTTNRIVAVLRGLADSGIRANIVSDRVKWDGQTALWITFDADHPLDSLVGVEILWRALVAAFAPDIDKIVRSKAIDFYWRRIVFVPLVQGKSLEKQAYANMRAVAYPLQPDVEGQIWRFHPEPIPSTSWAQLGLRSWERCPSWDIFDQFTAAYSALFHHVDHIADFTRCKVNLDEIGERIFRDYLSHETERLQPLLQETFDSATRVLAELPEWTDELVNARPNMFNCAELLVQMRNAMSPNEELADESELTIDEMAGWRERLKSGFELLGQARYLWIADSLGFDGFDFESSV